MHSIARSNVLPPLFHSIPDALTKRSHWVVWKLEPVGEKPAVSRLTKVPYNARTGHKAKSTDPATWSKFETAKIAYEHNVDYAGVGFVLTHSAGIVGIDLDHVVSDGVVIEDVQPIVDTFATYAELSPSGTGIRLFVFGTLPTGRRKCGHIEAYETGRFLTVTGHRLPGALPTVEHRSYELQGFHAKYFGVQDAPTTLVQARQPTRVHNNAVLTAAYASRVGDRVRALYEGDIAGYRSQSEADLALCSYLAFFTAGDAYAIDALFRASGLYRSKWDRDDYRTRTLAMACNGQVAA